MPLSPRRRTARTIAAIAVPLLAAGTVSALGTSPAAAAPSAGAVLSEVYGGGGNANASYRNDFIELANRGTTTLDVGTWSVQYLPAAPGATTTWSATALAGTIAAGDNYLVGEASGGTAGTDLPATQVSGSMNLSGTNGTVALVRSTTALTCKTAADCAADPNVVDLVGYGSAVVREGTPAAALTSTTSATRKTAPDTDDNSGDFAAVAPTPTGSTATPPPGPGPLRIHDIQGAGWLSPQAKKPVSNVPGIVTAVRTSGSRGFWFQDPNPDSDPATSEGVFVFTGSAPTVAVGDSVLVSGTVSEFYPGSDSSVLSITEIGSAPTVTVLGSGNALPAAVPLTPTTVPDLYAPDLRGGNIESTAVTPSRSALDFDESIEGMRAQVVDAPVVGPSNSFGEQYVTTKPAQARTYRGGAELLAENATPSGRLEVVTPGLSPAVDVGDVFGGVTAGPIDYSQFGGYLLYATTVGTIVHNNLARTVATPTTGLQLSVATYNVENLDPTDPQSKFDRLAHGIVDNLAAPDVVAVEEVQDNTGPSDDGTVAADATLTQLTDAVVAAGGPQYSWQEIDPVNDQDGGEPGGNIRVVFLYNPHRVTFVRTGSATVDRSTTATAPVAARGGGVALSLSPGRIDPTNPVWTSSRKPLVGQFLFNGKMVIVVANHFNSKGGDQSADGRYQYPTRSSETQRAGQAAAVHDFVQSVLKIDRSAKVVVVGDLNDYQFSPALKILETGTAAGTATPILSDLITTLPVDQRYTYVYNGVSQVLDHILVSPAVTKAKRGVRYQVVHLNAEYSDQASDHDPQVVTITP